MLSGYIQRYMAHCWWGRSEVAKFMFWEKDWGTEASVVWRNKFSSIKCRAI